MRPRAFEGSLDEILGAIRVAGEQPRGSPQRAPAHAGERRELVDGAARSHHTSIKTLGRALG